MKKMLVFLMIFGLIAGALSAPALAKKKKQKPVTVTGTYASPAFGAAGAGVALCSSTDANGCVVLVGGLPYVSMKIVDTTGLPVAASITQDLNGDQQADTGVDICGATTEPVAVDPGYPVDVFIFEGPCTSPPGPAVATSGTITATFTATP